METDPMFARKDRSRPRNAKAGVEPLDDRLLLDAGTAALVTSAYEAVDRRAPTAAEVSYWTQQLGKGVPTATFATALVRSPEHLGLEVDDLFEAVLHRHADAASKAIVVNALAHGQTEDNVTRALLDSSEYQKSHAGNTAFVQGLFKDVLGRPASASELKNDVGALNRGLSRDSLVQSFVRSTEREGEVVDRDFEAVLGRDDTRAEHARDVSDLGSGRVRNDDILIGLIGSPENELRHRGKGRGGKG
jgi:hypothetical protein